MRMDCAGWDEQTISGVQRDRRLAILLPDTGSGKNVKGDCCWVQMARIRRAGRVPRVPNDDLLAWCIGQFAPQQKRMSYWGLLLRRRGLRLHRAEDGKRRDADQIFDEAIDQTCLLDGSSPGRLRSAPTRAHYSSLKPQGNRAMPPAPQ